MKKVFLIPLFIVSIFLICMTIYGSENKSGNFSFSQSRSYCSSVSTVSNSNNNNLTGNVLRIDPAPVYIEEDALPGSSGSLSLAAIFIILFITLVVAILLIILLILASKNTYDKNHKICPCCGQSIYVKNKFCPNCGANMKGF